MTDPSDGRPPPPPPPPATAFRPVTAPPPPSPRPTVRTRGPRPVSGWVAVAIVGLIAAGGIWALVAWGRSMDPETSQDRADRAHDRREPVEDAEGLPKHERRSQLVKYCDDPGQAWDDVPEYDPTKPGRLFLWDLGVARSSALSTGDSLTGGSWYHDGGATQVSPSADPRLSQTETADTRLVACMRTVDVEMVGRTCRYGDLSAQVSGGLGGERWDVELQRYKYEVIAYELHSGDPVAVGFLYTRSDGCPDKWDEESDEPFTFQLTDDDVLGWVGEHFRNGIPQ